MIFRKIEITQAALSYGNLNLSKILDFFPKDVFGSPNKKDGIGRQLTLIYNDGKQLRTIETDIYSDKKIFRSRAGKSGTKEMVLLLNLKPGNQILLEKIDSYTYKVSKIY